MSTEKLLKASDVAVLLGGCHIQTVYKLAAQGVLPSLKINSWRRFRAADVEQWLEKKGGGNDG